MRLELLLTCLLVLYNQRADCKLNTSNTSPETTQSKLSAALISLAERMNDISPCQEPVVEFEDEMRGITLELSGVKDEDNTKFTEFLSHVFNMRKSIIYSCVLITATARDMMSRVEDIETFINKIQNYSGEKINEMLKITDTKVQLLANHTVNHLEEIKGELEGATEYLAMIIKDSDILGNKMKYLYRYGPQINMELRRRSTQYLPFVESVLAPADNVLDRNHKKNVRKQMQSFSEANEFGTNEKSIMQGKILALEDEKQKIKEIFEDSINSSVTVDQSNLILRKLQHVKTVLDDFLNIKDEEKDEMKTDNNKKISNMEDNDKVRETSYEIMPENFTIDYYD